MGATERNSKNRGKANEVALVEQLRKRGLPSARRVPMSGAAYDFPGDVEVPELSLLIEAKVYAVLEDAQGDEYIRFKLGWVPKIKEEAERAGFKHSVVIVRGKSRQKRYAVLDFDDYLKLFGTP